MFMKNEKAKSISEDKKLDEMELQSMLEAYGWTAYILIRHTIPAQRTGNIITIMWIVLTLIAIANGSP